jgi:hypothetical protein
MRRYRAFHPQHRSGQASCKSHQFFGRKHQASVTAATAEGDEQAVHDGLAHRAGGLVSEVLSGLTGREWSVEYVSLSRAGGVSASIGKLILHFTGPTE